MFLTRFEQEDFFFLLLLSFHKISIVSSNLNFRGVFQIKISRYARNKNKKIRSMAADVRKIIPREKFGNKNKRPHFFFFPLATYLFSRLN